MKAHIERDERWPEYSIYAEGDRWFRPHLHDLIDVPEDLVARYREASRIWEAVQDELRELYEDED